MELIKNIILDLDKEIYDKIDVKQNDTKSRYLNISLIKNSVAVELTNHSVKVYAIKPDKTKVFNNVEVLGAGKIKVELTSQMLAVPGKLNCELVIYGADSSVLSTKQFEVNVIESIRDDEAIESTNEYTSLTESLAKVTNIDGRFNDLSSQLAEKTNKTDSVIPQIPVNSIPSSLLKQATDSDKIKLANLSQEVRDAMAGTTTIGTTPAPASVTPLEIANGAVVFDKAGDDIQYLLNKFTDFLTGADIKTGAFVSDRDLVSTFAGFASRITYNGEKFKYVKIYLKPEIPNMEVKLSILKKDYTLYTSKTQRVKSNGWNVFELPIECDSTVIIENEFYVAIESVDRTKRIIIPNITVDVKSLGHRYNTTSSATWQSSSATYAVLAELISKDKLSVYNIPSAKSIKNNMLDDGSVRLNNIDSKINTDLLYPFHSAVSLKNTSGVDISDIMKSAIKDVKIYGASLNKQYALSKFYRGYNINGTPYWILSIYEVSGDTSVSEVCVFSIPNYSEPNGVIDRVTLSEKNSSGVTAEILIDWSKITNGTFQELYGYSKSGLHIKTYQKIQTTVSSDYILDIKLPTSIPAVVGKEVNVYFDNIIYSSDGNYQVDIECAIGNQQAERWTCIPTSAGTYSLNVKLYRNFQFIKSATTNIVVKSASVGNSLMKKCLFIGDSTTDQNFYTQGVLDNFSNDTMKVTLLGGRGTAPNNHEGRGGWTINQYYTDATSPFVFSGAFNFAQYMANKGYTGLERVLIHLGINDTFDYYEDTTLNNKIATTLTQYQAMVDNIKAYDANIKIGVGITIPPSKSQDAFGKNYTTYQTQWRYRRNWWMWVKALIEQFKGKEAQNIYLLPLYVNLDTEHNMQIETVQINSRNTATMIRQSNGVHPADIGYYQMSDIAYYWLKGFES